MMTIENISDTARWVAVYRAMETARPDAIFRDPFADRLAGPRGRQILDAMPQGKAYAWPMIVRTALFDEILLDAVRKRSVDLVVNLAAGLDARPWRLPLPPSLRWVDVDLPGILNYKTEELRNDTPVCRYEAVTTDLTDVEARRALFSRLGAGSSRAIVATEGLLIYLEPEQVASLAADLHAQPGFQEWVFDLGSPQLLKRMERTWGKSLAASGAPFRFAPAEGTDFFKPYGWREAEFRSMWIEAGRLKRTMKGAWFWNFVARFYPKRVREGFKRFSGIVRLERE
ncbi:MAG: class I SAM-dependent methyltransferase [Acidobacteriota bacterium]